VAAPERKFFLIPPGEYEIRDLVYSRDAGDRQQNHCKPRRVRAERPGAQLVEPGDGKGPGGALNESPTFHLTFVLPMLGAAWGA
jgi:hypothetical protein